MLCSVKPVEKMANILRWCHWFPHIMTFWHAGISYVSRKLPKHPTPNQQCFCPSVTHQWETWIRGGVGDSFPETLNDPHALGSRKRNKSQKRKKMTTYTLRFRTNKHSKIILLLAQCSLLKYGKYMLDKFSLLHWQTWQKCIWFACQLWKLCFLFILI